MSFPYRKPGARKKGLKILISGASGTGKTVMALSFPKSLVLDSEDGVAWYEGTDEGKNIVGIVDTQSYNTLDEVLTDMIKGRVDDEFETLVIDSETKVYENLKEALLKVEENRALRNKRNVLDANLSQRSWGQIGNKAKALQNLKIQLASKGINVVSVAQNKDIMEDLGNGTRVKVGDGADMQKKSEYDYDVVLQLVVENGKHYAIVKKDRTKTYKPDDKIENPSYENWAKAIASKQNQGATLEKDFVASTKESEMAYQQEVDGKLSFEERVKNYYMDLAADEREEFMAEVEKATGKKNFKGMDTATQKKVLALMD